MSNSRRKTREVVGLVATAEHANALTIDDLNSFHQGFNGALRVYRSPAGELAICGTNQHAQERLKSLSRFFPTFEWRRIVVKPNWALHLG